MTFGNVMLPAALVGCVVGGLSWAADPEAPQFIEGVRGCGAEAEL